MRKDAFKSVRSEDEERCIQVRKRDEDEERCI
jgi:phosphate uptake regulator